ncbi:hypothetical protein [Pleionea litopenaei]|uniref:DUF1579 domain-containing protein n=1 Tax=Pleionea litopenaei TaxID=3070815 RepID=A0AA51RS54_9GAMM|nr:hypothetical protein [Pleionea sp. HL-JVS1]WMS86540.1 hypothetical protein Q9312_15070 [Pleionea sp. HL-JVS1]
MNSHTVKMVLSLCFILMATMASATCNSEMSKQFDFWLGDWKVFDKDGKLVGNNLIQKAQNGCVITELYSTEKGYSGQSINIFDATRKVWHQTWVDNKGGLLVLEGKWNGQAMLLTGQTQAQDGNTLLQKIKWTPKSDGSVHQHWQVSKDKGQHWEDAFYGVYLPKKK